MEEECQLKLRILYLKKEYERQKHFNSNLNNCYFKSYYLDEIKLLELKKEILNVKIELYRFYFQKYHMIDKEEEVIGE